MEAPDEHGGSRGSRFEQVGSTTFRSLRRRNFRLLFVGQGLSQTGVWMQTVATAALTLSLTSSGLVLGLVVASQWLPTLLIGPWGGLLADRLDRRLIVLWAQVGSVAGAGTLAAVALTGNLNLPWLFITTAAVGASHALDSPARLALAADVVAEDEVPNSVGLNASLLTGSRVVGPLIGGLLITGPGAGWAVAAHALTRLPQFALISMMDPSKFRNTERTPRSRGQLREGLTHVWTMHSLRLPLILLGVCSLSAFNYHVTLPLMAEDAFDGGSGTYTILFAALSLGSVVGGLAMAHRPAVSIDTLVNSAIGIGLCMVALGLAPNTLAALAMALPVGYFHLMLAGGANAILQSDSDPLLRGRALALLPAVANGMAPVGGTVVGGASDLVGIRPAVVLSGLPCIVAALMVKHRSPQLRND